MNQIVIVGRLTKKPELNELENGSIVSNVTIAVPRSYKNSDGIYETDFINCALWGNTAKNIVEYCEKGDCVGVKGHIETKIREHENGKYSEIQLIAEKITFLGGSKEKTDEKENEV